MKSKFNLSNLNFEPRRLSELVKDLKEIEYLGENVASLDFVTEDGDTKLSRDISKDGDKITETSKHLIFEVVSSLENEFIELFDLFVGLARSGLIEEEFPFDSWNQEFERVEKVTKTTVGIDCKNILEGIIEIYNHNKQDNDLAKINFVNYLASNLDKNTREQYYFSLLDYTARQFNDKLEITELLSGKNHKDYFNTLSSKLHVTTYEATSRLADAATSISTFNYETKEDFDKTWKEIVKDRKEKIEVEQFKKQCEDFEQSTLWGTIKNNPECLNKFISDFGNDVRSAKFFFNTTLYDFKKSKVRGLNSDTITTFFEMVIKDDLELGEKLMVSLSKNLPKILEQDFQNVDSQVKSILNYNHLQKNTTINNVTELKKMKI